MQRVAAAHVDSPFSFAFLPAPPLSDPALQLAGAQLGYGGHPVLDHVDLRLAPDARIGLLGRNGAGKSTLLKSLVGRLPLLQGHQQASPNCKIGYYDQQQLEVLDLQASPALHLQRLRPEAREQEVLDFLGGFDFRGERATTAIAPFSGGEKARLALAMVVWQQPNLLVLDEPTNHLDLDMREALVLALQGFAGAVLLVTHDRHLLRNSADELWLVADGRVSPFGSDLDSYERAVAAGRDETAGTAANDTRAAQPGAQTPEPGDKQGAAVGDGRQRRQEAAARREQLKPLQRTVRALERQLEQVQQTLSELQTQLADPALYADADSARVEALLREEAAQRARSEDLELQWLQAQESLESLQSGEG
jgi:ATP-binding cassette subfamily F protein 3